MARKKSSARQTLDPKTIVRALNSQPLALRQILDRIGLPSSRRRELRHGLQQLVAEGQVVRLRGGTFGLAKPAKLLQGRISQTQPGFAFVVLEGDSQPDLYIAAEHLLDAMPDDEVEVRILPSRGSHPSGRRSPRAQVVRVLRRSRQTVVGAFQRGVGQALVRPMGMPYHEFSVPLDRMAAAQEGDQVVAKILSWPSVSAPGQAEIAEVLGPLDHPGVDITRIIRQFNLPDAFSKQALQAAKTAAQAPDAKTFPGRLDLRSWRIVTIDGADARDFDDAVYCEARPEGGWRLSVHIADVSHYVAEGSALDLEIRTRGTSVYFPDRVLHMLPEPLSCGVCSLVPQQDRLTVSAFLDVEPDGTVSQTDFQRTVIHSAARLTYEDVEEAMQGKSSSNPAVPFLPELKRLQQAAQALRLQRTSRGSLDFDLPDPRVVMGEDGRVVTIERRPRLESHALIEDCMIAANEAVARYLTRTDTPTLYRVHETPSQEKLEELKLFLAAYGYSLSLGKASQHSKRFQTLLASWQGKPEADVLNKAVLCAMKLAVYAPKNIGHFGLASTCYTHFTSPIRRYPDLIVHRTLVDRLADRRQERASRLSGWGKELSEAERRAEKAERQAVKAKQAEFMASKLGEVFEGIISGVTNFGFFVELVTPFVEGLVRVADLRDDYYYFDETRATLTGTNNGRVFNCGQRVRVKVDRVDQDDLRVVFVLADEALPPASPGSRRNPPRIAPQRRKKRL